jgi:CRISPR-associated protein Csx10
MKALVIELTAVSPLAIRADHAPGGTETAKYIPGSTLLGCLAATHRLLRPGQDKEFAEFFLKGAVQYPCLYPASFKAPELHPLHTSVHPLPQTAQSCKRFSGFSRLPREKEEDERHGVRDSLLDWAIFKYSGERRLKPLEEHKNCSYQNKQGKRCGIPLDHYEGYYRRVDQAGREADFADKVYLGQAYIETRLQTHTGINRERGIVEEGILYSREVIEEGMRFWGLLKLPENLVSSFEAFMREVRQEDVSNEDRRETRGLVRVGNGRTRGMGKVYLKLRPLDEELTEEDRYTRFVKRLEEFQKRLSVRAKEHDLPEIQRFHFALTLHSPVILSDDLLRYRGRIDGATLAQEARIPNSRENPTFELLYTNASVRRVSGWQELWGTPKTNEYAIETGSVFLFSCALDQANALLRPLFELEEQDLGKRRDEGFGRVCFSDPFHLEGKLQ